MRITHDPERCDPCLRLFNNRKSERAILIHPDGTVVHEWRYEHGRSWHYAEMLPNGHLVAVDKNHMVLELDRESRLVWSFTTMAHHDFARRENGNTYVVSGVACIDPAMAADRLVEYDCVYEVTPTGDVVWSWQPAAHAADLGFGDSPVVADDFNDWPHINTCEILPETPLGRRDDRFRTGNLLMCGRHINTIWIVDPESGNVVWTWGPGELLGPHMPTMLPGGTILIYDNGRHTKNNDRGWTRIIEIDPVTGEILWQYRANPPSTFYSPSRGSGERLPNGNHLIAESDSGRLFEVADDGTIVWELDNELRDETGPQPIYRVKSYTIAEAEAALGRSL